MHIIFFKIFHFNWFEWYIIHVIFFRFFKDGLNCSISTDDPGIMLITIFDDYTEVKNRMGLSIKNIQQMVNVHSNPIPTRPPQPCPTRNPNIKILLEPQCSQIVLSSRFWKVRADFKIGIIICQIQSRLRNKKSVQNKKRCNRRKYLKILNKIRIHNFSVFSSARVSREPLSNLSFSLKKRKKITLSRCIFDDSLLFWYRYIFNLLNWNLLSLRLQ